MVLMPAVVLPCALLLCLLADCVAWLPQLADAVVPTAAAQQQDLCNLKWLVACQHTSSTSFGPPHMQGVAGISCLWRVADYWRTRHGLPEQLPARMAERLRPARTKALHKVPSLAAAAAEEEAAGGAAAGRAGSEDDEEFDLEEAQAELMEEAADASDLSDDGGWLGG